MVFGSIFLLLYTYLPLFFLEDTIVVKASVDPRIYFRAPYYYNISQSKNSTQHVLYSNLFIFKGFNYTSLSIGGTTPEQNSVLFANIYFPNAMLGYTDISLLPLSIVKYFLVMNSSTPLTGLPGIGGTVNLIPETSGISGKATAHKKSGYATLPINNKFRISTFFETFVDSYLVKVDNIPLTVKNTGYKKYGFLISDSKQENVFLYTRRISGAPPPIGGIGSGIKKEWIEGLRFTFPISKLNFNINQSAFHQIYTQNQESDTHFVANIRASLSWRNFSICISKDFTKSTKIGTKRNVECVLGSRDLQIMLNKVSLHPSITLISDGKCKNLIVAPGIAFSRSIIDNLFIFSSISRTYRAPTFNELYWPEDVFARGNPNLKPESGYNLDVGVRLLRNNIFFSGTIYAKKVKDAIMWVQYDKYMPTNFTEAEHFGSNMTLAYRPSSDIECEFNFNFQKSFINRLPYPYRPSFSITSLIETKFLRINLTYIGKRPERLNSTKMLPPICILDGAIKKYLKVKGTLFEVLLGVENLLGTNYMLIPGYPQPGRSYTLEVSVKGGN